MDWPQLNGVLRIKPVTDEKSRRKLWNIYKKKKKIKPKPEKKEKQEKKEGIIDIYA